MKFMLRILTLTCVFLFTTSLLAADFNIGTVNLTKVLEAFPEAKTANQDLQKRALKKQQNLLTLAKELEKLTEEYAKHAGSYSEAQRKEKASIIQKRSDALDIQRQAVEAEFAEMEKAASRQVFEKLKLVIAKTAKEADLDLVLPDEQIIYAKSPVDLTEKVIKNFK